MTTRQYRLQDSNNQRQANNSETLVQQNLLLDMLACDQSIWHNSFKIYLNPPESEVLLVSPRLQEQKQAKALLNVIQKELWS